MHATHCLVPLPPVCCCIFLSIELSLTSVHCVTFARANFLSLAVSPHACDVTSELRKDLVQAPQILAHDICLWRTFYTLSISFEVSFRLIRRGHLVRTIFVQKSRV